MDTAREQRYQMVLRRLEDLAGVQEELRQRIEDMAVQIGETREAQAGLVERVATLERILETPCPHQQQIEDMQVEVTDLARHIDVLATEQDRICTTAGIPLPVLEGLEEVIP